ncbi:unnamed protein product [Miscanthus lutarioriparius]|uniref:Uncharacterized protein n=1 Tax=Miscanthus lutarioriparius TaxID=422564 RepID=A0A811MLR2_9POAL|nr:unnamed protein product [Miscanthus lutarioriparius]
MDVVEPAGTKLVGAALIKEVVYSPTRVSLRLVGVVAEHTLVRAERLMQSKNLECNKGVVSSEAIVRLLLTVRKIVRLAEVGLSPFCNVKL